MLIPSLTSSTIFRYISRQSSALGDAFGSFRAAGTNMFSFMSHVPISCISVHGLARSSWMGRRVWKRSSRPCFLNVFSTSLTHLLLFSVCIWWLRMSPFLSALLRSCLTWKLYSGHRTKPYYACAERRNEDKACSYPETRHSSYQDLAHPTERSRPVLFYDVRQLTERWSLNNQSVLNIAMTFCNKGAGFSFLTTTATIPMWTTSYLPTRCFGRGPRQSMALSVTFLGSHPLFGNWSVEMSKPSSCEEAGSERAVSISQILLPHTLTLDFLIRIGPLKQRTQCHRQYLRPSGLLWLYQ